MSTALAIASVTAALKQLLENGLVHHRATVRLGEVTVSTLPPDQIAVGPDERAQLNLYLYRVTANSGWRSHRPTSEAGEGSFTPPLALDLHYLLTAYGSHDLASELLLGAAMSLLQATPTLSPQALRIALAEAAGAAEQDEPLKVSPEFVSMEEMSRLWSSLQARYRLSASYKVSVVVLEGDR